MLLLLHKKTLKVAVLLWMAVIMFVYLLLFGPPEFWWLMQRLGLDVALQPIRAWLTQFFTAGYQS